MLLLLAVVDKGGVVGCSGFGVFKSFAALPAQKFGCKIAARSSQRGHLAAIYGLFLLAFSNRIRATSNGVGAGVGKSGSGRGKRRRWQLKQRDVECGTNLLLLLFSFCFFFLQREFFGLFSFCAGGFAFAAKEPK